MSTEQFEYQGQLVYRPFEYRGQKEDPIEILDLVPNTGGRQALSSERSPTYTSHTLTERLYDSLQDSQQALGKLQAKRLTKFELGDSVQGFDPDTNDVREFYSINKQVGDLAILDSQRVLIRGATQTVNACREALVGQFGRGERLRPIQFEPDFLLWIYWTFQQGQQDRLARLSPIRLTSASFTGDSSVFGQEMTVKGNNLVDSSSLSAAILSGNQFQSLSGLFELDGRYIQMSIDNDGRIQVRAAADLRSQNSAERFVTATRIADRFTAEYFRWTRLPKHDRYPPAAFFKQLHEAAQTHGINITTEIDDMLQRYAELRGEDVENYIE